MEHINKKNQSKTKTIRSKNISNISFLVKSSKNILWEDYGYPEIITKHTPICLG